MNRMKIAEAGLVIVSIFICSYMVNFVWESFHAVFLYEDHDFNAMKYDLMVSYVSAIDGFLILGIYLLIAALWRDAAWNPGNKREADMRSIAFGASAVRCYRV